MKNLYYISAQPATKYYLWQVEVMINNFLKNRINPERVHILCAINNGLIPAEWDKLRTHYSSIRFFFYNDTRINPSYISSIRPNILKQHFLQHLYLKDHAVFYHDCDMILTHPIGWEEFIEDDIWYLSDTISYIGANYIKSKRYGVYERMCEIVGIPENIPEDNEQNSGGAQYIMKNVDANFWEKVEYDSEALYTFFRHHLQAFPQSDKYHPIQMWTADMWAVLWNAWYFGHTTKVVKEMDFAWPGHPIDDWNKKHIFHNAGVTGNNPNELLFYKGDYIHSFPHGYDFSWVRSDRCSFKYVQEIMETSKVSCLV